VLPKADLKRLPPFHDRVRFYCQTTFSPFALTGPIAGAAATLWGTGNPPEGGQGFPGYGRRLLSGYSREVIANFVGFGVGFAAQEDPRHYPTGEHGLWRRGLFASHEALVSHNPSGGRMPAYSRIIGEYSAGFMSNTWYPAPYSNVHSALYRGSTALASDIVCRSSRNSGRTRAADFARVSSPDKKFSGRIPPFAFATEIRCDSEGWIGGFCLGTMGLCIVSLCVTDTKMYRHSLPSW
jgi:hypothetical protein